jgi:NADH-quinone oxidoreductase subunit C
MEEIINHIKERFSIYEITEAQDSLTFVSVKAAELVPLVTSLKANHGYSVLVILSAVDWLEDCKFQLTYIVNNPEEKRDLGIRVYIKREEASMDSIHSLWEHAATFQREIREMFGIQFPGSPRVDDPFLLEGWDNMPPMRRDFDTKKYAEETYFPRPGRETNDPAEYMKQKLYPDE